MSARIDKDLIFAISDPVHKFKGSIADRKKQAFEKYIQRYGVVPDENPAIFTNNSSSDLKE
mgnify:CR=1 FL=1